MKRTAKKPTKKQLQELRVYRAYQVAAETVLFMHVDKLPVTVEIAPKPEHGFYSAAYAPTDSRMMILTTIGVVASPMLVTDREVEGDVVYEELLSIPDPNCFMDKITAEEVKNMVTLALCVLVKNWYVVESIATKLLSYALDEQAVVNFAPAEYSFTK
jgi:hypothetical protein